MATSSKVIKSPYLVQQAALQGDRWRGTEKKKQTRNEKDSVHGRQSDCSSQGEEAELSVDTSGMEVHDWVVGKLQLSSSMLSDTDLARICNMVSVYLKVSVSTEKLRAARNRHKEIFKMSGRATTASDINSADNRSRDEKLPPIQRRPPPRGKGKVQPGDTAVSKRPVLSASSKRESKCMPESSPEKKNSRKYSKHSFVSAENGSTSEKDIAVESGSAGGARKGKGVISGYSKGKGPAKQHQSVTIPSLNGNDGQSSQTDTDSTAESASFAKSQTSGQLTDDSSLKPRRRSKMAASDSPWVDDLSPILPDMKEVERETRNIRPFAISVGHPNEAQQVPIDDDVMEIALAIYLAKSKREKTLRELMKSF